MADPLRILLHNDKTQEMAARGREAFPEAIFLECNSYDGLPDMLAEHRPQIVYTVRFAGSQGYPRDALFGPDGPAWIANGGAGTDHFGTWDAEQTLVTNAAGVAADMMAEYVIGGLLHFTLDIPGLQQDKRDRVWAARTVTPLAGKTLLVIGLGHTGRATALRAKAFGMHVLGTRARPKSTDHVDEVHGSEALPELLPRADAIAICTPLIPATKGLISAERIAQMKPGVLLADVSRGGVVDQTALHAALESGHVAGAELDVFETEPLPQDSPLWSAPNALLSPHCAAVHSDWEHASFTLFLRNLRHWTKSEALFNVVDPIRGY